MKKLLFFVAAALAAMSLMAAPVDQATAVKKAKNYLANELYAGKLMAPAAMNPVLLKAEVGDNKLGQPVYYIFNTSTTFLVMAGDDRAEEILMVGDEPLRDINNLSPSMKAILNQYKEEITFLQEHPTLKVQKPSETTTPQLRAVTYGPLLTAKWDQMAPYWSQCVFTYNNKSYQCLTGCPATSASMVLYYWKYPTTQVPAVASYTATLDMSYYQSVNFTYPAVSATTFDWANMKDTYTSYNSTQSNAVATLMRYVGQLEKMMYGTEAAGGSGIYTTNSQIIATMFKTLGYDSNTRLVNKSSYSDANWNALIQAEMAASRPVVYLGVDPQGGGHAFNVDGYRDSDGKYHVNFGWSGDGNSWYAMNSFTYGGYTFSQTQQAIVGIQPPGGAANTPQLTVNPTSLSFTGATTGQTYTKTFTVSGANLTGNVTISSSNNAFTVSPSTLTAAQAQAGATVTVTYAPTTAGTHSGNITVASSGATSKTVTVSGSATAPTPVLTVNPTSLNFSGCVVGQSYTQTFTVSATNVTGSVNISSNNARFTVSPSTLTAAQAMAGATITVTYSPTAAGTHTGTISVTSTGATTKSVSVSGTATSTPTMTVTPSTLNMSTEVGTPVTAIFHLQGSNLTSTVMLSVSGTGFSINKNNILKSAANNGTDVTVTYSPTSAGTHTGTVTLTSNGAETVTVTLNGTATSTVPTLNVDPTSLSFNTIVGTPVTQTFTVTGVNLTNSVYLTVSGAGFAIDKTNILKNAATNGSTVTVTYNPTVFGTHTGTVTLTSNGAEPVTVALNGVAGMLKFAPVMQPADESYINTTTFRADWNDQTAPENVASYTLEVSAKTVEPEPEPELIASLSGTSFSGQGYYVVTLQAPWSGTNTRGHNNEIIYFRNNYDGDGSYGNITYTVPAGYENATFTVKITSGTNAEEAVGNLTVATPQTAGVTQYFNPTETYSWLVTASSGEKITITTPDAQYSPDIALVEIYSGNATEVMLKANESGDALYRLITGITDKFYTVNELAAEGTFLYKVKALYLDGTESEWSNIEEVTLFASYLLGDVNKDGHISIKDATDLIDYLLGGSGEDLDLVAADFNSDNNVSIKDATDLIDYLLGGGSTINAVSPNSHPGR